MKALTLISRLVVGLLFIFSGLIKANDPIGFSIKLDEYFTEFGFPGLIPAALGLAIFICAIEIALGVALLIGARVKLTLTLLVLMMIFFTWLTGYSAVYNKVTDCGCFGDAIKLTPWQSFIKDIILLVFLAILIAGFRYIRPLMRPRQGDIAVLVSFLLSLGFSLYCYFYLPVIDFLPFKEGVNIEEGMKIPPGAPGPKYDTQNYYKSNKTGETKGYIAEDIPFDDSLWVAEWEYDTTITKLIDKGFQPAITGFDISDGDRNTVTDQIFAGDGYKLLIVAYDLSKTNMKVQDELSQLAKEVMEKEKMEVFALTKTSHPEAEAFRHEVQAPYEFWHADETVLKTMIRSNPGLILLKKNVIVKKWSACGMPDYYDLLRYIGK